VTIRALVSVSALMAVHSLVSMATLPPHHAISSNTLNSAVTICALMADHTLASRSARRSLRTRKALVTRLPIGTAIWDNQNRLANHKSPLPRRQAQFVLKPNGFQQWRKMRNNHPVSGIVVGYRSIFKLHRRT